MNLLLTDIQSNTALVPQMNHLLSASIRSKLNVIFQVKFKRLVDYVEETLLDDYYLQVLTDKSGFTQKFMDGELMVEEIHFPCSAIQFSNVARNIGYFEPISHFPYTMDDLLSFVKTIKDHKILMLSSEPSKFFTNCIEYLQSWGADITSKFYARFF